MTPITHDCVIDVILEAPAWEGHGEAQLTHLIEAAVAATCQLIPNKLPEGAELSVLLCDDAHIQRLNHQWRDKDKPTNVLSFPSYQLHHQGMGEAFKDPALGDIVIAYETVQREAREEGKTFENHLTHLVIHGFLHLLGYDHEINSEAEEMEAWEVKILDKMQIANPYLTTIGQV